MTRPCRACGRWLRFAKTKTGKGLLPLMRVRRVYVVRADESGEDEATPIGIDVETYVSHFETCPKASSFSRPRGPST